MNVAQRQMVVMKMLIVLTMKDLSRVHARQDLVAVESCVQVGIPQWYYVRLSYKQAGMYKLIPAHDPVLDLKSLLI